jgi:hypothetical protein
MIGADGWWGAIPSRAVSRRHPPVWLLDVDGVLNAVTGRPDPSVWPDWQRGTARAAGRVWPIWFSPTVTATIAALHADGLSDVRWLTTWEDAANGDLRELLGLPELEVVARADEVAGTHRPTEGPQVSEAPVAAAGEARWWKLSAAQAVPDLAGGRGLIWTDDDLALEDSARAWAHRHVPRARLFAPPPQVGITPAMLHQIVAFCHECAGADLAAE